MEYSISIFGEETKKVRDVVTSIEVEGEDFVKIKIKEVEENREWLDRSVVGIGFSLIFFDIIEI